MEFYKLGVYNTYRYLFKKIYEHTQNTPRFYKYSLVLELSNMVENQMMAINDINELEFTDNTRVEFLNNMIHEIDNKIKIRIRNLYELRLITKKGFGDLSNYTEKISRQLKGWKTYTENLINNIK